MMPAKRLMANPMLRRYGVTAVLSVLLVGVAAVIGYEVDWGQGRSALAVVPTKVAAQNPEQALLPTYVLPPIDPTYKETVERPLFIPTRRPAPEGTALAAGSMKKGQYKLTGTSINSTMTVAYLVETASGKALRALKGAEVGPGSGIKVDKVEATRVILRQGDETEELTLRTAASPPRPATAVVAAPPAPGQPIVQQPFGPGVPPQVGGLPPTAAPVSGMNAVPLGASVGAGAAGAVKPASEASSLSPAAQAVDPNAALQRRRRFQNLPQ